MANFEKPGSYPIKSLSKVVKETQKKKPASTPAKDDDGDPKSSANPKKFVIINPPLVGDERNRMNEARSQTKIDYLIRLGLGDQDRLNFYRQVLTDPKKANQTPYLRQYVSEVLDLTLDIIFNDPQMYNRVTTKLQHNLPQGGIRAGMKKIEDALLHKAERSGIHFDTLVEVYNRGIEASGSSEIAFNRVNSFIAGGKASRMDVDLLEVNPEQSLKTIKKALKGGRND